MSIVNFRGTYLGQSNKMHQEKSSSSKHIIHKSRSDMYLLPKGELLSPSLWYHISGTN